VAAEAAAAREAAAKAEASAAEQAAAFEGDVEATAGQLLRDARQVTFR